MQWESAFAWFFQIAEGLAFAHARGVAHRHISPYTVIATWRGGLRPGMGGSTNGVQLVLFDWSRASVEAGRNVSELDPVRAFFANDCYIQKLRMQECKTITLLHLVHQW